MGLQASKLYRKKDRVQDKVMSLLGRKMDALKRRRSHSNLSKQMLLNPGSENASVSSRVPDDDSIGSARVVAAVSDIDFREHDSKVNGDDVEAHKSIVREASAMEKLTLEEKDKKTVEETERLKKERSANLLCPGSPSFRFYLTDNDKEEDYSSKDDLTIKGPFSDTDAVEPPTSTELTIKGSFSDTDTIESLTSTKKQGSKMKGGRRGMRFRRVIPMGRPVKNFLKVKSCYYPSCGGGQKVGQRLITEKPAEM